jgi:hypothetical protein
MKKYLLIFLLLISVAMAYLTFYSKNENISTPLVKGFPSIKNGKLNINDKPFYPVTINYILTLQADKDKFWITPFGGYYPENKHRFVTKDSCLMELEAEFNLIKQMGFNSIRIVRVGEVGVEDKSTGRLSIGARINNEKDTTLILWNDKNYDVYFDALEDLFQLANKTGLKIIYLVRLSADAPGTEVCLEKLTQRFKNEKAILAYDFFNEPLYFDTVERDKEDVYFLVKRWNKIVKKNAPNQLTTIGLAGIREVFEWDPNILDVDFISLHPYEYEPDQVRNELYWYGKYIKKPWLIGETAISADNDSVSYMDQLAFAEKTIKQTYNCGSIGYSWWQFKDVDWKLFHANFMGVINWTGETVVPGSKLTVKGTVKPVVQAFQKFNPNLPKEECLCASNYYNYSNGKECRLKGKLIDENGNPIEGGLVLAWNEWWSSSYHTVSKKDGTFELLGTFPFYHWMASATEYSRIRGELKPDTAKITFDTIPTMNIGNVGLNKLILN